MVTLNHLGYCPFLLSLYRGELHVVAVASGNIEDLKSCKLPRNPGEIMSHVFPSKWALTFSR